MLPDRLIAVRVRSQCWKRHVVGCKNPRFFIVWRSCFGMRGYSRRFFRRSLGSQGVGDDNYAEASGCLLPSQRVAPRPDETIRTDVADPTVCVSCSDRAPRDFSSEIREVF